MALGIAALRCAALEMRLQSRFWLRFDLAHSLFYSLSLECYLPAQF